MKPTRRQFLATGAVAGAGALAGCDQIPFIGGGGGIGQFANWVPAKSAIHPDLETIGFSVESPSQINSNRQNFDPQTYRGYRTSYRTGIEWSSVNMSLSLRPDIQVYTGSFDANGIDTELTTESGRDGSGSVYTQETSEGNYEIYIREQYDDAENADSAYAVKGDTVIYAPRIGSPDNDGQTAIEAARTMIEVGQGNDRAVDENDEFNTLKNQVSGTIARGGTFEEAVDDNGESVAGGRFEGTVAQGLTYAINGAQSERKDVYVFDDESDVDTDDIEEYVERNDTNGDWQYARNTSVNQNGNVATISATFDTFDISP